MDSMMRDPSRAAEIAAMSHAANKAHPTPCTLYPSPCRVCLHLTPSALHLTPYTLHPTPYTLHPTPYTLHPEIAFMSHAARKALLNPYP